MNGKICLITGANSGLGKAMSIELASRGATIIMACRRNDVAARDEIKSASGNDQVSLRQVDLSDLQTVIKICDELRSDGIKLDVVHLNAGMAASRNTISIDGYPLLWQVNFLANALLVRRLLNDGTVPNAIFSKQMQTSLTNNIPRILFTSSSRYHGPLSIEFSSFGIFPNFSILDTFKVYGLSKLYMMTYLWELGRQLQIDFVPQVSVTAFCPGSFRSRIGKNIGFLGNLIMSTRPVDPREAIWPGVFLACSPNVEGKTMIYYYKHQVQAVDERVTNKDNAENVWIMTESILNKYLQ